MRTWTRELLMEMDRRDERLETGKSVEGQARVCRQGVPGLTSGAVTDMVTGLKLLSWAVVGTGKGERALRLQAAGKVSEEGPSRLRPGK